MMHRTLVSTILLSSCLFSSFVSSQGSSLAAPERSTIQPPQVGRQLGRGNSVRYLTVNGHRRWYLLHIPKDLDQRTPAPVILGFHGGAARAGGFAAATQLSERGDSFGFVVVYPQGYGLTWNAGDCCGAAQREGIDDVAFIKALLEDLATVVKVDHRRIFATGWSNGGKFAYRLACELSESIGAVAVVGSAIGIPNCTPKRPVSVLHLHGTADTFHPYSGGRGNERSAPPVNQVGAPETVRQWAKLDGCTDETRVTYQHGTATCVTHPHCKEGAMVTLCTIKGMGHQWPGHTLNMSPERARQLGMPEILSRLGPGTNDLDATDMVLTFFRNHPIPG